MYLQIKFKLDNAAFKNENGQLNPAAIAREVYALADDIADGYSGGSIRDLNGNTLGRWDISR